MPCYRTSTSVRARKGASSTCTGTWLASRLLPDRFRRASTSSAESGCSPWGVGAYFEIAGLSQRQHLDIRKPTASCLQSDVDSTRTQMRIGDITLGGGLLFLAGATVLYLTRPTVDTTDTASPREGASATPWFGPVRGGFVAGARGNL